MTSANLNRWFCGYNSATRILNRYVYDNHGGIDIGIYFVSRHSPISYLLPSIHSFISEPVLEHFIISVSGAHFIIAIRCPGRTFTLFTFASNPSLKRTPHLGLDQNIHQMSSSSNYFRQGTNSPGFTEVSASVQKREHGYDADGQHNTGTQV